MCAAAGIDVQSFGLLDEDGLNDLGVTPEDQQAMLFLVKQLQPLDVDASKATLAEHTPAAAAAPAAAAVESTPRGGAAVVGAASAAAHFAALDDAAHDAELPWPPSQWIEGDSLAPPCSSNLEVLGFRPAFRRHREYTSPQGFLLYITSFSAQFRGR